MDNELLFSSMFENHLAVMLLIDPETGRIIDANGAASKYYGYSKETRCSMRIEDINMLSPDEVRREMRSARGKQQNYFIFLHRLASGEERTVEVYSSPIEVDGRKLLFSIIHDISERKTLELELDRSLRRYKDLIENVGDGIALISPDLGFSYVNPAGCKIFGEAVGSLDGGSLVDFLDEEGLGEVHREMLDRANGVAGSYELATLHRDGTRRLLLVTARPRVDDQGKFIGSFAVFSDVTKRKETEAELKQALKEKETLFHELQHRVKNSLLIVNSLLELELDRSVDEGVHETLRRAQSKILTIQNIYDRIYISPGSNEIELDHYLEDLASSLFERDSEKASRIRLAMRVSPMKLDSKRAASLGLILNELVNNALKYAYPPQSGGEVRVVLAVEGSDGTLSVADDGPGLPASPSEGRAGSMGLDLVAALVDQIQGTLEFPRGAGTIVFVRFPI
jgi:PAS domain S-box-containing protein